MIQRPRRNRKTSAIRKMIRETHLRPEHLVYPLFVQDGDSASEEISSLPGNFRWSGDALVDEVGSCIELGLNSFVLFPKVDSSKKDALGSYGLDEQNFYLEVAQTLKESFPSCTLVSDIALDPYNSDGHDGVVRNGVVANDETVESLCQMAILQARAGFDILGPSDMMDGRIGAMRDKLDNEGFHDTAIMSYTAKYASAFYGPFRDALDSAPVSDPDIPKDKKTYQMDPANKREALREADLDVIEGADYLMVKPAVHYMDVIQLLKQEYHLPIAAYHVSGECAMLMAACQNGWLNFEEAMPETLLSLRRAGADIILTYFAKEFALRYKS